jgi:hypothetical protein
MDTGWARNRLTTRDSVDSNSAARFPLSHLSQGKDSPRHVDRRVRQIHVLFSFKLIHFHRQVQASGNDQAPETDVAMQDVRPAQATEAAAAAPKKRPRLDLTIEHRERKRGKSMFGLLVGTLNKAKTEDEARNASEAVRYSICIRNCTDSNFVSGQETSFD